MDTAAFEVMNGAMWRVDELSMLLQASCIGNPIAVACWFEYADRP